MRRLMMYCPHCDVYTLELRCPRCGRQTVSAHPPKFSPEDKYGEYRRKAKIMEKKGML